MGMEVERFTEHRRTLFGIAYRMLGSATEADDIVQEAYLRARSAHEIPAAPGPWLATIVTRLCLDVLKSARARRETYVGTWLPEPVLTGEVVDLGARVSPLLGGADVDALEPGARLDAAESVSMALLVLLETLSPLERAAFVLRDVFDWEFDAIAAALERTPSTCRQLVHRARQHIASGQPRFRATEAERQRLLGAFVQALSEGDASKLASLFADDVVASSDGGGKVKAARRDVIGPDRVSRLLIGLGRLGAQAGMLFEFCSVNGGPALLLREHGRLVAVLGIEVSPAGASLIWMLRNPDKLGRLEATLAAEAGATLDGSREVERVGRGGELLN
ncbi:RNA polymerase sigma factor SigJ [Chondromyces crocatus]|nr:RNA polymerase sigma factor SigJ [Chondromyces crocatus]